MIDPAYYTVANGDGHTTAARETDTDVGGDLRSAAERGNPLLREQRTMLAALRTYLDQNGIGALSFACRHYQTCLQS